MLIASVRRKRHWLPPLAQGIGAWLLLMPISAFAAQPSVASSFYSFETDVGGYVSTVLTNTTVMAIVIFLWSFFAVILLVWTMVRWSFGRAGVADLLNAAFLLLFTKLLINTFDLLTKGLWGMFSGIADAIQSAVIGHVDVMFLATFVQKIVSLISVPVPSVTGFVSSLQAFGVLFLVYGVATALSVVAYITTVWALWGYTLAKLVGLFFIPTLLWERTSFLFDGWLRFFLGFLLYGLIARVNLILVGVAMCAYFHIPLSTLGSGSLAGITGSYVYSFSTETEGIGLLTFLLIGVVALFATGRFAASLSQGASVNVGSALGSVAHSMTQLVLLRGR
ncbi:MAG: type IV secretion system protein [Betaproteobacteria bacterium]|nr:type IV secretion system protein [Betaproteobacteria bacterium]